jgi:hypothetical protein
MFARMRHQGGTMKAIITNESKEQKSLDWIGKQRFKAHGGFAPHYLDIKNTDSFKNLQALVDKSIPMKVKDLIFMSCFTENDYIIKAYCPNCNSKFIDYNKDNQIKGMSPTYQRNKKHCNMCGQTLDWSDSNE